MNPLHHYAYNKSLLILIVIPILLSSVANAQKKTKQHPSYLLNCCNITAQQGQLLVVYHGQLKSQKLSALTIISAFWAIY